MLPDITYNYIEQGESSLGPRWSGVDGVPAEITDAQSRMTREEQAWARLVGLHYRPKVHSACDILSPHNTGDKGIARSHHIETLKKSSLLSWNSRLEVEVGFSMYFRSMQTVSGMNLEDVARCLLLDTMIWTEFGLNGTTLDIMYTPASDPGPPYDGDTDFAIFVVPQGMRGVSPASRYHQRSPQ